MRRYKLFTLLCAGMLLAGLAAFAMAQTAAQPPAAAPAAAAPAATPGVETVAGGTQTTTVGSGPQGLVGLILSNIDVVFVTIILCSITGFALIIQGFIKNRREVVIPAASVNHCRQLIENRQFKELLEFTESDPSFVSRALNPALKRAPSFSSMKEAMETAIGEQTAEMFRGIEYLNILGNLGPLLGLLGTVWGMIVAFEAMRAGGGNADPAVLAGGISKALCHTFMGLFLAIPCLAAFGVLRTMVDRLTISGALQAEEMLLMIKPAEAKPAANTAVRPGGATPQPARKAPVPVPPAVPAPAQP